MTRPIGRHSFKYDEPTGVNMPTRSHRANGRRALLTVLLLGALAAVVAVAFVTPAGGGESPHTRRSAAGATVSVEYPREVRVADLPDSVVRRTALAADPPVTVLVELAPGVYANRGPGPLGTLDDYTAVFGECAAINRYAQSHRVGRAC